MPVKFEDEKEEKLLTIQVNGKLTSADYVYFAPEFERLVQLNGKVRVLFDLAGFQGWEEGAQWESIKFDFRHFSDIERIAIIGEKTWEAGMANLHKPFTKATIRFFDHAQVADARQWLGEV